MFHCLSGCDYSRASSLAEACVATERFVTAEKL